MKHMPPPRPLPATGVAVVDGVPAVGVPAAGLPHAGPAATAAGPASTSSGFPKI